MSQSSAEHGKQGVQEAAETRTKGIHGGGVSRGAMDSAPVLTDHHHHQQQQQQQQLLNNRCSQHQQRATGTPPTGPPAALESNRCKICALTPEGQTSIETDLPESESSRQHQATTATAAQTREAKTESTGARQHLPNTGTCCHFGEESQDTERLNQPSKSISGMDQQPPLQGTAACGGGGDVYGGGGAGGESGLENHQNERCAFVGMEEKTTGATGAGESGAAGAATTPSWRSGNEQSGSKHTPSQQPSKCGCCSCSCACSSPCSCSSRPTCAAAVNTAEYISSVWHMENKHREISSSVADTGSDIIVDSRTLSGSDGETPKPECACVLTESESGPDQLSQTVSSPSPSSGGQSSNNPTDICDKDHNHHQRSLVPGENSAKHDNDGGLAPESPEERKPGDLGHSLHSRSLPTMRRLNLPQILTPFGVTADVSPIGYGSEAVNGSTKSSPLSFRSCSPTSWSVTSASPLQSPQKHVRHEFSARSLEALLGTTNGNNSQLRIARDPIQPHSGSISDIHVEVSGEEEEADVFDLAPMQRPRSRTWSENRAWQRKRVARAKAMTRPPTPPPGGVDRFFVDKKVQTAVSKEKLKIPDRDLPELPESSA